MLTDTQLMLLEQLTYLGQDVYKNAGLAYPGICASVKEMVSMFTEENLKKLAGCGAIGYTNGSEWAAIIRSIQNDRDLMRLQLSAYNDEQGIFCFTDSNYPGKAIVAFCGTKDGKEWADNLEGLAKADTECQKAALDFIENLSYEDITVVGHSKGGNKAQYVTVLSDKVRRCVSMDGQGFSQEFLDKYWAEIEEKACEIRNYSVANDYVNILMFYVPGAKTIYCYGENDNGLKNHSASSFFRYEQDENRNWYISHNSNGDAELIETTRDEIMTYLHEFTCFIINEMPDEDKKAVIRYLGMLFSISMDEKYRIEVNGTVYTLHPDKGEKGFIDLVALDLKTATMIIAYLVKYIEVYDLTEKQIRQLLSAFGEEDLWDELLTKADNIVKKYHLDGIIKNSGGLLLFIFKLVVGQITDGKRDPIIESMLSMFLTEWLTSVFGRKVDAGDLWADIQREYNKIGDVNPSQANRDGTIRTGTVLNFSENAYSVLLNTISFIEGLTFDSVASWKNYSSEEWYDPLSIGIAVSGISSYFKYLSEINANCKDQIECIFTNIKWVDLKHSQKILEIAETISGSKNTILRYAENIVVS